LARLKMSAMGTTNKASCGTVALGHGNGGRGPLWFEVKVGQVFVWSARDGQRLQVGDE
jgi:hypothetical protein